MRVAVLHVESMAGSRRGDDDVRHRDGEIRLATFDRQPPRLLPDVGVNREQGDLLVEAWPRMRALSASSRFPLFPSPSRR